MSRGMNNDRLKRYNRGLVFQLLSTGTATSRVELAHKSKLSKMTLSYIISEFIELGYVEERANVALPTRGNPMQLRLAKTAPKIIGVYICRACCQAAVCDFSMNIIDVASCDLPDPVDNELLAQSLYSITDPLIQKHKDVMGIGIGSIGPVDIRNGIVLEPLNFGKVRYFPVKALFEERYRLPVCFEYHYNCSALTEELFGNGKGYQNLLYVGLPNVANINYASGVGMGVVCGGQLYSSFTGYSSELGHVAINSFDGPLCPCGNRGCLGVYANIPNIMRDIAELPGQELMSFQEICQNSNTPGIDRVLMEKLLHPLIYALTSTITLLNPDLILLGDIASELPSRYLGYMEQRLNERIFARNSRRVVVKHAKFPPEYNAAMCASAVIDKVFHGEYLF